MWLDTQKCGTKVQTSKHVHWWSPNICLFKVIGEILQILGGMEIKACISLNTKHIDKDMYEGIRCEYDMAW